MKNIVISVSVLFLLISCKQSVVQKEQESAATERNDVEVYYFHKTERCATCRAVEAEARKNVEMLYPELYSTGKITFTSLNIDEDAGRMMGDQFGVLGQTLLIVSGDKKVNITHEGFMYAEGKPDKFMSVIKEKVDSLMN